MGRLIASVAALLLIAVMIAGVGAQAFAFATVPGRQLPSPPSSTSVSNPFAAGKSWKAKVDPALLNDRTYSVRPLERMVGSNTYSLMETLADRSATPLPNPLSGKARIMVFYDGSSKTLSEIEKIAVVTGGVHLRNGKSGIVFVWADKGQVEELAKLPGVMKIVSDKVLPLPGSDNRVGSDKHIGSGVGFEPDMYGAVNITGARYAWSMGYNGTGVKIAVVDTGIDMGESDLGPQKVARDAFGHPLLFDADEQGLVVTLNPALYVGNNTVMVEPITVENMTGVLFYAGLLQEFYITNTSFVAILDTSTYDMSYFEYPVVNATFKVPANITENSTVNFGLAFQALFVGNLLVEYTVPVIFVDYNGDGVFDAAYADLSTTYYLLMLGLYQLGYSPEPPNETLFDMSFADEKPFNYTHPVVARDFTGDGVNDFSLGAVAGAFNDAVGIFTGRTYSFDWLNDWESVGYILPGFSKSTGIFFDLLYDWESHGTFCAHVAAGLGKVPRPLGYGEGNYTLPGMAPGAKLGGASALWMGNVIIAELYLSGFYLEDPSTFTWVYTGWTQADVISNSWGSSYLFINGYATDADPTSIWEDYITLTSGTVIVHAAGNGGPGFGSVTIPGAATAVITVGAGTEFFYRPFYGYLPGAYGQVVSWSDRGPTQFAYPKPDVIAIGSFAWSVGRTIDGLGNGVYAFDLFSGTSEATPMTAGAVAILIQALRANGYNANPFVVKAVLKASATSLGYDAFSQGSGMINLKRAIDMITEGGVVPVSRAPYHVAQYFVETMATMLGLPEDEVMQLWYNYGDTAMYFGVVKPGSSETQTLYLPEIGPSSETNVTLEAVHLVKKNTIPLSSAAILGKAVLYVPGEGFLKVPNKYVVIAGDYVFVNANLLPPGSRLLIPVKEELFNATLTQIDVNFPYKYFDPYGRQGDYTPYFIMGSEVSYWIDYMNAGIPVPQETSRIQYDIRGGNSEHVQIGEPLKAFELAKQVALQYLEEYYGINATNATSMPVIDLRFFENAYYGTGLSVFIPIKVDINNYVETPWTWINVTSTAQANSQVPVTVSIPSTAAPGVYEGFIKVSQGNYTTYVPVTVAVPIVVEPGMPKVLFKFGQNTFYDNYVYKGALDQYWRPEVGDWRTFPVVLDNSNSRIVGLKVDVYWADTSTDFDLALIGPGYNFWGVADMNYTAWIDAGTVAAKISGIASLLGLSGVYTYFDYPSATHAMILAPVASPVIDPEATTYWLVLHQVFSGTGVDRPVIVITPLTEYLSYQTVKAGTVSVRTTLLSAPALYNAKLGEPIVIPLTPGASGLNVVPVTPILSNTTVKTVQLGIDASEATPGTYLVIVPVASTDSPSVVWGFDALGEHGIIVSIPFMSFLYYYVTVQP